MATETLPFDAARTIASEEGQAELLADAIATGDARYIANVLGVIARARGMTEVACGAGVTREELYRALGEEADPRLATLLGVIRAFGFRLSVE